MSLPILEDGWMDAVPVLQALGFLAAFLAGGLVAAALRRRPVAETAPAGRNPGAAAPTRPSEPKASDAGAREYGPQMLLGHEMKNYLCVIKGNARLLRMGGVDPVVIDRIDRVVDRLETLAWRGAAAPDVTACARRTPVDLVRLVDGVARSHFADGPGIATEAAQVLSAIPGDPQRLEQVFMNLFGNSREAGAKAVSVRLRRIGNELEVSVEDDGRGCRPEDAARLFEPFYSTKPEDKRPSGLGLFIVRSIVENHGGRIRASSKNGRGQGETGLVVYLNFPIPALPAPGDSAPASWIGRRRVALPA